MRGRQILMESLIAQGVELHLRQSGDDREPHHRQPARLPPAQLHRGSPRGGGRGRGQLLRAGQRQDGRRERPRGARARQRHRHDVQRAEGERSHRRHRRAAGHAHASPRSPAGARSRGHGGPGDEVERPGRASRRAAPAPASRVQGGERSARRSRVRGPAHRRDGAGVGERARGSRHAAPGGPRGARRSRRGRGALGRPAEPRHRRRGRGGALRSGSRGRGAGRGAGRRDLDRGHPHARVRAQQPSQLPAGARIRRPVDPEVARGRRCRSARRRPLLRRGVVLARVSVPHGRGRDPGRGLVAAAGVQPRRDGGTDRRSEGHARGAPGRREWQGFGRIP